MHSNDTPDRVAGRLDCDPKDGAYHVEVDWASATSVSTTVVLAVSELAEDEAVEPLIERVDPDALDALFAPHDGTDRERGAASFPFAGYCVRVDGDSEVAMFCPSHTRERRNSARVDLNQKNARKRTFCVVQIHLPLFFSASDELRPAVHISPISPGGWSSGPLRIQSAVSSASRTATPIPSSSARPRS